MKRNMNSKYLITRLFSIDYFYYYSNPAFFSAYFFPFIAIGKSRAYLDEEFEEKITNVKNNYHGNFYNYATQGFGNIAFDTNLITFDYFYEKLSTYETEKYRYFNRIDGVSDLETDKTKKDVYNALNKDDLMLKRDVKVADEIKIELISDLQNYEVKYVLAKVLYYIVNDNHMLPNVDFTYYDTITKRLNIYSGRPNIHMACRKKTDMDMRTLNELFVKAEEVQLICKDGVSLFGDNTVYKNCVSKENIIVNSVLENKQINIEVILQVPNKLDSNNFSVNIKHLHMPKSKLSEYSIKNIKKMMHDFYGNRLFLKTTKNPLPYALMIFHFKDSLLDFLKLDLYSPFISDNCDRPSMYILKKTNPVMFEHFQKVFDQMWNDEFYSQFV